MGKQISGIEKKTIKNSIAFWVCILSLFAIHAPGQDTLVFEGFIMDKNTQEPLPFADVCFNKSKGTISNNDGYFKFHITTIQNNSIKASFHYLGYLPRELRLYSNTINKILLEKDTFALQSVYISSKNFIVNLLESVIDSIPDYFPTSASRYEGFYREMLLKNDEDPIFIGEAYFDFYKSSYEKKRRDDQVKILKSKYYIFVGPEEFNEYKFYGGPFLIYSLDYVKHRTLFLDKENLNFLDFQIKNKINVQDNPNYILEFNTKNNRIRGNILVQEAKPIVTGFEYKISYPIDDSSSYRRDSIHVSVAYDIMNNKYILKNYQYKIYFTQKPTNEKLIYKSDYLTTSVVYNAQPINMAQAISKNDIFMDLVSMKDTGDYWAGINTIIMDSLTTNLVRKNLHNLNSDFQFQKPVYTIFDNFFFGLGVGYLLQNKNSRVTVAKSRVNNREFNISYSSNPMIFLQSDIGFLIHKSFSAEYGLGFSLYENNFIKHCININYHSRFLSKYYNLYNTLGINTSWIRFSLHGNITEIGNEKITSQYKSSLIGLHERIKIPVGKNIFIYTEAGIMIPLFQSYHTNINYTGIDEQYFFEKPHSTFTESIIYSFNIGLKYHINQ